MSYLAGDLRDQLAHVGDDVVRAGLVVGSGGNLSARVPGDDACWVTAAGTWLDRLGRPSFVRVRISDGAVLPRRPETDRRARPDQRAGAAPGHLPRSSRRERGRPSAPADRCCCSTRVGERIRLVTTDHAFYLRRW